MPSAITLNLYDNDFPESPTVTLIMFSIHLNTQWLLTFLTFSYKTSSWNNKSNISEQVVMICFNVSICKLVTSQKQILNELKSNWLVILTRDLLAVILSPVAIFITYIKCMVWCNILCVASMQDNPMECFTLSVSNNHGIMDIATYQLHHLLSFLQAVWDSICAEFANIQ